MRVAVIGVGAMGQHHVRIYNELDQAELVGIADPDKSLRRRMARLYKVKTFSGYKDMIAAERPEAVSIAVPTSLHKEVAVYALSRGISVLLEKPIAASLEEGKAVIAAAKRSKAKLMVGHIERFNPAVIELKKQLRRLGKVYRIDVNRVGPFPSRITDCGVVKDLATHDIDIMHVVLESRVSRIYAETEKRIHTKHEDLLAAILKFRNGAVCSLNINWLTPTKVRKLYISGERGMFLVNYLTQRLYFYENDSKIGGKMVEGISLITEGNMTRIKVQAREPLRGEIEHFVDCVRNNKPVQVSGQDGLNALLISEKIIESADKHKVVSL